jgi:hypothetical protein
MTGSCKLCGRTGDLQQSHVLPSFAFKWMKQAGHIRRSGLPNRRSQDGEKREWLCWDCEQLFNSFETPFATKIFHLCVPKTLNPTVMVMKSAQDAA